jgi:hypothetical protein
MERFRYKGTYTSNFNNQSYIITGDNLNNVSNITKQNAITYSNNQISLWYVIDTKTNKVIDGGKITNNKNYNLTNDMKSYLNNLYNII